MGKTQDQILAVIGYALCARASSHCYLTGFGAFESTIGYVATPVFTVVANVSIILSMALVAFLLLKRSIEPGGIPYPVVATCALLFYLVVLLGVPLFFNPDFAVVAFAIAYAATFPVLTICWYEQLLRAAPRSAILLFLASYFCASAFGVLYTRLNSVQGIAADMLLIIASAAIMRALKKRAAKGPGKDAPEGEREDGGTADGRRPYLLDMRECFSSIGASLATAAVLEGVVGLLNIVAVGGSFTYVFENFPTWLAAAISAVCLLLLLSVINRRPEPYRMFQTVFPILLAALLLLLLFGENMGAVAGAAILVSYNFVNQSMAFILFDYSSRSGTPIALVVAISTIVTKSMLLIGLVAGTMLVSVSSFSSVGLEAAAIVLAVYLLSMALVAILGIKGGWKTWRKEEDGPHLSAPDHLEQEHHKDTEGAESAKSSNQVLLDLKSRYHLTTRESEVYGLLLRGWSAKRMAQELYLSENTIWGHIKHIYSKLGVSGKQQAIALFELEQSQSQLQPYGEEEN